MDTGTCSRRRVFRKGSCSSCPLLLTIFSVFRRCWNLHITTASRGGGMPLATHLQPFGGKSRPGSGLSARGRLLLVRVRILGGAKLDPQGGADQVELLAEPAFQEALVGVR